MIGRYFVPMLGLYLSLQGCGRDSSSALQNNDENIYQEYPVLGNSTDFQVNVANGDYDRALESVCSDFQLACNRTSVGRAAYSENLAETSALSNRITLSTMTFYKVNTDSSVLSADYSERFKMADRRALALFIVHEIFHQTKQPQLTRFGAARAAQILRDPTALYQLELDAWQHTLGWSAKHRFYEGDTREKLMHHWAQGMKNQYQSLLENPDVNLD